MSTSPLMMRAIHLLSILTIAAVNSPAVSGQVLPVLHQETAGNWESEVFVVVTDKSGRPVNDLKPQDFAVSENGKQAQVLNVTSASSTPVVMGILVDFSGSARTEEHRKEDSEALASFFRRNVHDPDAAFLVAFGMSTFQLTGVTSDSKEFDQGVKELMESQPIGATALFDSLITIATTRFQKLSGHKVILVLSDFQDNSSRHRMGDTILAIQGAGVSVFGLIKQAGTKRPGRAAKIGEETAKRITGETGGEISTYASPRDLETQLDRLWGHLKGSYLVRYRSAQGAVKGIGPKSKVEVRGGNVEIHYPERAELASH